jgi:hypothetical protein
MIPDVRPVEAKTVKAGDVMVGPAPSASTSACR